MSRDPLDFWDYVDRLAKCAALAALVLLFFVVLDQSTR